METVHVKASRDYNVQIGRGLLPRSGELIAGVTAARRCALVADETVFALYGGRVAASLEQAGASVCVKTFPSGERSKNLTTYGMLLEFLAENRLTRSDFVVALGGGVTGDMAGFAAATYLRGVDYIQIPTTFLAAGDSSVGGKTAVDLAAGKNLAGAFWPPRMVICDCDTFDTLPDSVFADGVAETLKHGLIADGDFFRFLMENDIRANMELVVRRNVEIKASVVAEDEFEHGRRQLLNFGHTLGHAIEQCSGFTVSHGRAVATGMVLAARGAERMGYSPAGTLAAVIAANERYGLPTCCPYGAEELYAAATADKKRDGGRINLVILQEIGRAATVRLDLAELRQFVEAAL